MNALIIGSSILGFSLLTSKKKDNKIENKKEEIDTNVNNIVDKVVNRKFKYEYNRNTNKSKGNDEYSDDNNNIKELKNICSDFVVKYFVGYKNNLYNFLDIINDMYYNAIDYYIEKKKLKPNSIYFLYKGGNILRIIANEFLIELPGNASKKIENYYSQFFKLSDADYGIYIDPTLPNFEEVHRDMTDLSFILQSKIRDNFYNDIYDFFDYYKYNDTFKNKILNELVDNLNNSNTVNNVSSPFYKCEFKSALIDNKSNPNYQGEYDFIIEKKNNKTNFEHINDEKNDIYISINNTLDFKTDKGSRVKFNLVRSKLFFNTTYFNTLKNKEFNLNLNGELIDVSITHKSDSSLKYFFDNINNYVSIYKLNHNDKTIIFKSYSFEYLVKDLERILFVFNEKPWNDSKYQKRLNRLFYLCYIDSFIKLSSNKIRFEYYVNMKNKLLVYLAQFNKNNLNKINKEINIFLRRYNKINLYFDTVIYYIKKIINNIETNDDIFQFRNFVSLLIENCNIIINSYNDINFFCKENGQIADQELYQGKFNLLI